MAVDIFRRTVYNKSRCGLGLSTVGAPTGAFLEGMRAEKEAVCESLCGYLV